jgi:autotransporter-associated beta strand protein
MEVRITPSTIPGPSALVWTGASDSAWTNAANWSGGQAPTAGDSLIFPSGAVRLVSSNDFPAGTPFQGITISGAGYSLGGNPLTLTGSLQSTYNTGSSVNAIDMAIAGGSVVSAPGGTLDLSGTLTGSGGLNLSGGGTLALTGSAANAYSGATVVTSGTLVLAKQGAQAIPGDLTIGDGWGTDLVRALGDNQISDASTVTINNTGQLDLNGHSDAIGGLHMTGGSVATGSGVLCLGGDVTISAGRGTATISGRLDLGGTRLFFVDDDPTAATDLDLSADVVGDGAGLAKFGFGTMRVSGANTYNGMTSVLSGTLVAASNGALGTTGLGTMVGNYASLALAPGVSIGGEALTLGMEGSAGPSLQSLGGSTQWAGPVMLNRGASIGVDAGSLTVSGSLGSSSTLPFSKDGAGELVLAGANTFRSGMIVNAGTVTLTNTLSLGTQTGLVSVRDGATLAMRPGLSFRAPLDLTGNGVDGLGALRSLGGASRWDGALTLRSPEVTINVTSGQLAFGGRVSVLSGFQRLNKIGAGTLYLGGATYV